MSKERRGFARLYVGVEAVCKHIGKGVIQEKVLVEDVSISGVRFISNEVLKENDVLEFTLTIPNIDSPIRALGKVIWQKKFSESFFETGLQFDEITPEHKNKLADYIKFCLGRVEEHREFVRCNLSTMVSYAIAGDSGDKKNCLSVDVSSSGLRVFVKEKLPTDAQVNLSFNLPEDRQPINAEGIVIWSKKRVEDNFFDTGVEFTKVSDVDRDKLNNYVKTTLGIDW